MSRSGFGTVLLPGTPDHYRDRLQAMAESVLKLARGELESTQSIAELRECIALLDEDAMSLAERLAAERRRRFTIVK